MKDLIWLIIYNIVFIVFALVQIIFFVPLASSAVLKGIIIVFAAMILIATGFIDGIYFCMEDNNNE